MNRGKRTEARKLKDRADDLCRQVVRSRGACERCGRRENLQWAHIIRRNHAATRTDEHNAWCLCARCHWLTEKEPDEFMALVERTIGITRFQELKTRAKAGVKTSPAFWQAEIERLSHLLGREAA